MCPVGKKLLTYENRSHPERDFRNREFPSHHLDNSIYQFFIRHAVDSLWNSSPDPGRLVGIILAPFLHADFGHLMANSSIALIVVFLVALSGRRVLWLSSIVIALVAGIGTWLFGGSGTVHIGASGVIFGWLTFLIVRGLFTRQLLQILLGGVVLFSYGSVLWGVLPTTPGVSWQGHLFGAIGGLVAAWLVGRRNLMAGMRVASV
nr:rhomboid family intramembrane serine protease [Corynebacterium auriscanis]